MPSTTIEPGAIATENERAELHAVLQSDLFVRSPALANLLSYLCEKMLAGEGDQIKEYSLAVDVFGRPDTFDQDADSIVRVQVNRLRKRLAEFYSREGAEHRLHISIPVGHYVPVFEKPAQGFAADEKEGISTSEPSSLPMPVLRIRMFLLAPIVLLLLLWGGAFLARDRLRHRPVAPQTSQAPSSIESGLVGLPVGDELRILAGSSHSFVDRSGKLWSPDAHFSGGTAVRSAAAYIWRTQDPTLYRTSRQGDFNYDIPLKPGNYELHLHFAETFYGPEDTGGGGEGSRIMTVSANQRPLLLDFDVLADAGGGRTADVRVFVDIHPAEDGLLHPEFLFGEGWPCDGVRD